MDLLLLWALARSFRLNKRRLFGHYFLLSLLAGCAIYAYQFGQDAVLAAALRDTAVAGYLIFIFLMLNGHYKLPKPKVNLGPDMSQVKLPKADEGTPPPVR